jgi:23S rRNA (adenine2503-C2)-methyltransferase
MNTENTKKTLSGLTLAELEQFVLDVGEPKFRAKQLHYWLYKNSVSDFDSMTSLSKDFRAKLKDIAVITDIKIKQKLVSSDGTIKYLLEFPDGNSVETVLMKFDKRPNLTACVSSQVGCSIGCIFCATGKRGFIRNLAPVEIVDQILTIQRDTGLKVTNIVYMGQGEPFLNYENVMDSIKILNDDLEIGIRRITISTSGIEPAIYKLSNEHRQLTLALSLHATTHELRQKLMPIEKKYSIESLIKALKHLSETTGRRVTIEYVLIDNVNDRPEHANELIFLLKDLNCNINLIPYNAIDEELKPPSKERVDEFRRILENSPKKVTVRLERGADILAACGQLSGSVT